MDNKFLTQCLAQSMLLRNKYVPDDCAANLGEAGAGGYGKLGL